MRDRAQKQNGSSTMAASLSMFPSDVFSRKSRRELPAGNGSLCAGSALLGFQYALAHEGGAVYRQFFADERVVIADHRVGPLQRREPVWQHILLEKRDRVGVPPHPADHRICLFDLRGMRPAIAVWREFLERPRFL